MSILPRIIRLLFFRATQLSCLYFYQYSRDRNYSIATAAGESRK